MVLTTLTDQVDDWTPDPEDTVSYGQPPVLPEEQKSPDYQ